jgi:hypothetical protein
MPTIIDIDKFKEQIPGYDPSLSGEFQSQAGAMADAEYDNAVKQKLHPKFILMCGGSASGKSEFVSINLHNEDAYIFDSTLSSNTSIKARLSKIRRKFECEVIFIQPENLLSAFIAFNGRKRKFHYQHFIRTHSGARENMLMILNKYENMNCRYILSSRGIEGVEFKEINVSRQEMKKMLELEQRNPETIEALIKPFIKYYE